MSNELTLGLTARYEDSVGMYGIVQGLEQLILSPATLKLAHTKITATTSQIAVALGDISSRGTLILVNRDTTNFVSVKVASSGAIFAKLWPQGSTSGINFCIVHLGSGAQSPFVQADTASCEVEVFLVPL